MDRVRAALRKLAKSLSPQGGRAGAEAILTTDAKPKEAALRLEIDGRAVTIGGIAKGVGMIQPHLATMFCFAATDAVVAPAAVTAVGRRTPDRAVNRIPGDAHRSTSDTAARPANGVPQ